MNVLPTLYKRSSSGKIQQWTIYTVDDTFYVEHGQKDGKIVKSKSTTCKPKNTGKANATTAEEQALKEAQAKWQKQLDKGYCKSVDAIDNVKLFVAMKADAFKDRKKEYDEQISKGLWSQPKLDGIRGIVGFDKSAILSYNHKVLYG